MKKYIHERVADREGGIELARMECIDRERWRLFYHGDPLRGHSRRE